MSIMNRFPISKKALTIIVVVVSLVLIFTIVPNILADAMFRYQAEHRLDNIDQEFMAVDYVCRQYLDGERNFMLPKEIVLCETKTAFDGVKVLSVWTDNSVYYGPASEYSWGRIEIRESIYD